MSGSARRPTVRDIATAAGVSVGAVSFALNGRSGVSDETRARVQAVAAELGWQPNVAARALSAARANAIGMVIARPRSSIASERFFFPFICGVEQALVQHGLSLVLHIADSVQAEMTAHRNWWGQHKVDAVVVVDMREDDPRPELLDELGMPAVYVGEDLGRGCAVVSDEEAVTRLVIEHLAARGHRVVAYVAGLGLVRHTERRRRAFAALGPGLGMTVLNSPGTDVTEAAGANETAALLAGVLRPDAIVYDNEILAIGGIGALDAAGVAIPADIAVLSWEDSPICRSLTPTVTALQRDPETFGGHAGTAIAQLLATGRRVVVREELPQLVVRGSSRAAG